MQTRNRSLAIANSTLNTLVNELGDECQTVLTLLNQLQLNDLSSEQKANVLADLLAASIHLHVHCDEQFQTLIADELEALPDPSDLNSDTDESI